METTHPAEEPQNRKGINEDGLRMFLSALSLIDAADISKEDDGSLIIVRAPPNSDFNKYGLRLQEILLEHSTEMPQHDVAHISVILVDAQGSTFEIKEEHEPAPLGYINAVYDTLNREHPNGRVTIWIVPGVNGLAELNHVIARKGHEVILTTQENSQLNSWPDLWSRRLMTANIFE